MCLGCLIKLARCALDKWAVLSAGAFLLLWTVVLRPPRGLGVAGAAQRIGQTLGIAYVASISSKVRRTPSAAHSALAACLWLDGYAGYAAPRCSMLKICGLTWVSFKVTRTKPVQLVTTCSLWPATPLAHTKHTAKSYHVVIGNAA